MDIRPDGELRYATAATGASSTLDTHTMVKAVPALLPGRKEHDTASRANQINRDHVKTRVERIHPMCASRRPTPEFGLSGHPSPRVYGYEVEAGVEATNECLRRARTVCPLITGFSTKM